MAPQVGEEYDTRQWHLLNKALPCCLVLYSPRAIDINIQIIRVFTKMRELLTDTLILKQEIEEIKKKLSNQGKDIELVFNYLDELIQKKENTKPRTKIGYKKVN